MDKQTFKYTTQLLYTVILLIIITSWVQTLMWIMQEVQWVIRVHMIAMVMITKISKVHELVDFMESVHSLVRTQTSLATTLTRTILLQTTIKICHNKTLLQTKLCHLTTPIILATIKVITKMWQPILKLATLEFLQGRLEVLIIRISVI